MERTNEPFRRAGKHHGVRAWRHGEVRHQEALQGPQHRLERHSSFRLAQARRFSLDLDEAVRHREGEERLQQDSEA